MIKLSDFNDLVKIANDRKDDLESQLNAIMSIIAETGIEPSKELQEIINGLKTELAFIESTLA